MYPRMHRMLASIGVLIYAGIGLICMFLGGAFLDYSKLSAIPLMPPPIESRSLAMLGVEIGVAFTVTAVMFSLYADLSSRGKLSRGL